MFNKLQTRDGRVQLFSFRLFIVHERTILFVFFQSFKNLQSFVLKVIGHFNMFRFLTEQTFSKIVCSVNRLSDKTVRSVKNLSLFSKVVQQNCSCGK